jgi:hypothetical protein
MLPAGNAITIHNITERGPAMLFIIAAVLIALWLLGLLTSHAIGGFIHILLVIAVIVVLVRIIQGRKVL